MLDWNDASLSLSLPLSPFSFLLFSFSSNFNTRPKIYYDRHDICLEKRCLILRCSNNDNDNSNSNNLITSYSLHQREGRGRGREERGGGGGKALLLFRFVSFGLV